MTHLKDAVYQPSDLEFETCNLNDSHSNQNYKLLILCPVLLHRKAGVELEKSVSPLSDASKKRLIEDTEDWHPRTGTSQSRSFRILAQMTGTENGEH